MSIAPLKLPIPLSSSSSKWIPQVNAREQDVKRRGPRWKTEHPAVRHREQSESDAHDKSSPGGLLVFRNDVAGQADRPPASLESLKGSSPSGSVIVATKSFSRYSDSGPNLGNQIGLETGNDGPWPQNSGVSHFKDTQLGDCQTEWTSNRPHTFLPPGKPGRWAVWRTHPILPRIHPILQLAPSS